MSEPMRTIGEAFGLHPSADVFAQAHLSMPILDALPFPVRVADAAANWRIVNTAAERLFGIKREDMLGKPCNHNKFCICGTKNCSLQRAKRGLYQTHFTHGCFSYTVDVEVLRDAEGSITGFIEIIHDVTSSNRQQENLKSILNGMDALITVYDPDTNNILFLNDSIRAYYCIEGSGVGEKCYQLLQGRDTPCVSCPNQQLLFEPDKIITWEHKESIKGRILHKTARLIDWPNGKKAHLEYAIDITDLIQAEKALQHREQMLEALNRAAIVFLSQNEANLNEILSRGFSKVAQIANIDRMSVSRNILKQDGLYATQIYRWSRFTECAIAPLKELNENPYEKHIPRWAKALASGECINGAISLFPEAEAEALQKFGCKSLLVVPFFNRGDFWGFVLFEDLQEERSFSDSDVSILRSAAFMIVNAVIHNEEAEKARAADEQTKLMLEAMPLSCVLWNADRQIIDCNEVTVQLHGLSSKEECISRFFDGFKEQHADSGKGLAYARSMMEKAFEKGMCTFEWTHCTPNGEAIPLNVRLVRMNFGKEYLVAGYAQDMREYKRMMNEIDRKTNLLQVINRVSSTFLSSTADAFYQNLLRTMEIMAEAVQADRVYIWKNFKNNDKLCCKQIYEWSNAANVPRDKKFTGETVYGERIPEWKEILSKGLCINGIVRELSLNEQAILVPNQVLSVLAVPIFLKGEFWGFIGFDDCHTERQFTQSEEVILRSASGLLAEALVRHEMEKTLRTSSIELQQALSGARAASVAKTEFLSSMSHEMRTPLNAVIGMTAIGRRSADIERKNYALDRIEEASTHLLGVINDILDMSKIEAGKLELSPVEFNFEQMLQKVITVISYRVSEKRQQFTVTVDGNVPRFVIGDDQRLSQVITNLLANAAKFTPEHGKIHLDVSLAGEENAVNELRIEVADNGIGISEEQQAKLFQSFGQAQTGTSREFGGTGLGLVISKRLVEMMDGRIWVESEQGKGSRFIFTVKVPGGAKNLRSMLSPGVAWESMRVLAVDSSGFARQNFKESFNRLGIPCETAADGPTACHIIEKHGPFDAYFIDLYLSGLDGVELTKWIRAHADHGKIVLSSSEDWERLQEVVRFSGADKGLVKPILSSALVDCMNDLLGNRPDGADQSNTNEFAGKSLLLAEDIEINREIVLSLLEGTGLHIECAENGKEALKMIEERPTEYDIVFMDIQMPYMDGLTATRQIRALPSKWCKEIPIIAMTANVFKDDIDNCMNAGMNGHIGKPIEYSAMMEHLHKHLRMGDGPQIRSRQEGRFALALFRGDDQYIAKLSEGTKVSVDIRTFDEQGRRGALSLPTIIEEVYPDGFFLVRMPMFQNGYYPLPRDEMFLLYFMAEVKKSDGSDMFVIPARFVERIERDSSIYAKLEPLGKIERSQRRDCYRLPLSIAVTLRRNRSNNFSFSVSRTINLSDGGMLLATDADLEIGEVLSLDFSLHNHETVEGTVLRTNLAESGEFKFTAAIEFISADRAQKERFYTYIMEKQMENSSAMNTLSEAPSFTHQSAG